MAELRVELNSHNFVVKKISSRARSVVVKFAWRYVQWETVKRDHRFVREPTTGYYTGLEDKSEYRFHINQLKDFKQSLELDFIKGDMVEWVSNAVPEFDKVEFEFNPEWQNKDREEQIPAINYLGSPDSPVSKFVGLATGVGKSYCTMRAMSILQCRTVAIMKPGYIQKWIEEFREKFRLEFEDIIVAEGSDQLTALLALASQGPLKAKIVIISNRTLLNWYKLYKDHGEALLDMGYDCLPGDLCQHLRCGLRVIDEVHQDFHFNFKVDLYTHVKDTISLSATMLADDGFINKMYEIAYPSNLRYNGGAQSKYIVARAVFFRLQEPQKVRYKDFATKRYSHNVFEKSILKSKTLTDNYVKLIDTAIRNSWVKNYKPGNKLIIFCASVALCTLLTERLKVLYPDKDVRRYVEQDPYENLMEPDIRVTTLISAGTAVDIPGLQTTIMTTAVSSSQANVQGLGRLRKMKDGQTPEFLYFVCEDIVKHIEYHERKKTLFMDRVLSFKVDYTNFAV